MKVTITLDASDARWLKAFADANGISVEQLFLDAARCFADAAGKRTGSWEADVGRNLLISSGHQLRIPGDVFYKLTTQDTRENEAWRKTLPVPA